jgi:tripartite-type tricarboxylate transporter receptor subunit TctC
MSACARSFTAILCVVAALMVSRGAADAESWPTKPLTFINAFAPGSIGDSVGRAVAQGISDALSQPVVVENRSGSGGALASAQVARVPADGYTLLMTTIGPSVLRPLIDSKLSYDAVADFTPIILVGDVPNVLATSPHLGFQSVQELVAYAKRNPGRFSLAHAGPGTVAHLLALLFTTAAGVEANYVGYRGAAPMMLDLAGGQVDAAFPALGPEAKVTTILGVASDERVDFLPGIPTMKEGNYPSVVGSTWYAIYTSAGLPPEILAKLNSAINAYLERRDVRERLTSLGFRILGGSPQRLQAKMNDDRVKWSQVITSAHISIEP